ncbi:hypothetical protein FYJ51_01735 [Erysipelotrichaceae bacterium Oil+RF-744-GAM-WT-6]|uniref:Uncharacterized protein n=1 Tax=Stecheria intestinalis TaxID=2606630 RepID=A0A7X2NQT3_9FIRM|nr:MULTISPECIES: hypothetical protein [Erysipelotrichaceae]MDD5881969.1 hypothetical protein [Stecheria intestinalis]MSS57631.1 hypothetical protein [Stecheria intestinalis]
MTEQNYEYVRYGMKYPNLMNKKVQYIVPKTSTVYEAWRRTGKNLKEAMDEYGKQVEASRSKER